MSLTLGAARNARRLKQISGVCTTSSDFVDILNDSTEALMDRGSFWNTIKVLRGCIYNNCITWPRSVGTVLAMNRCGQSVPPKNGWYNYDAVLPEHVHHWNRCGAFPCASDLALVDGGTSPVFNQIPCLNPRYLRFYITQPSDVGKTITVFGVDGNGLDILTTRSDGTIQPGIVLSLAIPFVQTPILISRVDRIIKDETDGPVYARQFDGAHLFDMATYGPNETLPDYRTSRIQSSGCASNCNQWPSQISAFVKIQFIPVVHDDDEVQIENLEAQALAIQSIKLSDSFDSQAAETMMSRAVHVLNLQLRTKLPIDQIPVNFSPQGTAHLSRRKIGLIQ
jgi:hypothetical protein